MYVIEEKDEQSPVDSNGRRWRCDEYSEGEVGPCLVLHEPEPRALLVQPVEQEEIIERKGLIEEVDAIAAAIDVPFAVAFISIADWNQQLSPWQAPAVFGKADFGAGARETLQHIENLLPELKRRYDLSADAPVLLGGYSLAALFSLWSAYESHSFHAIAAASPSVWFPGWLDYAKVHHPQADIIYLSLGDREDKTRNPIMRTVSICIQEQRALLQTEPILKTTLAWNPGNHFQHPEQRCAKGFIWCMEQLLLG